MFYCVAFCASSGEIVQFYATSPARCLRKVFYLFWDDVFDNVIIKIRPIGSERVLFPTI